MKNLISTRRLCQFIGVLVSLPLGLSAAEVSATVSAPAPLAPAPQVTVSASTARLPYAAAEVVKLTRAQVSEDIVISYVQNSSSTSSLSSDDIVQLRNEGVSDRVVNAMMNKHSRVIETLPNASAPAPVYADTAPNTGDMVNSPQQPAVAPLTPSSSYVIPYPPASAAYYGYYSPGYYSPYYYGGGPYYGYYGGPVVSFRFGFGGGYRGGYHGGYRGGGIQAHGHR